MHHLAGITHAKSAIEECPPSPMPPILTLMHKLWGRRGIPREGLGGAKTVPPLPLPSEMNTPNVKMGGAGEGDGNRPRAR